jgi:signal transduction histidine kinase
MPLVAAVGSSPKHAAIEQVPITYQGLAIGELRVAARGWDEPLSRSDLLVLSNLARQVGIALYAAQLTRNLQYARERLVIAREEERRRIRNDLHDGLAPTLASLQLQLREIRRHIRQDPAQAEALASDLHQELRQATAQIRELVYDLRPPMLDELGLVGAIKNFRLPGSALTLVVNAPEPLPKLPAAVEVAVYRITSEAIHNAVKHAQATMCVAAIEVGDGRLTLSVRNNGAGLPDDYHTGVGLRSMKERAAELGGTLAIRVIENGDTQVTATLPLN